MTTSTLTPRIKTTKNSWRALKGSGGTSWALKNTSKPSPVGRDFIAHLNKVVRYDIEETHVIEVNSDLYLRATTRLATKGKLVPAEDVVGDLDDEE